MAVMTQRTQAGVLVTAGFSEQWEGQQGYCAWVMRGV